MHSNRMDSLMHGRWSGRLGILLLTLTVLSGCKPEGREVMRESGFKGEAARFPYLAAEMFAERLGTPVRRQDSLFPLPQANWILVVDQSELLGLKSWDEVLDWVAAGGRLWIGGVVQPDWHAREARRFSSGSKWAYERKLSELQGRLGFEVKPAEDLEGNKYRLRSLGRERIEWPAGFLLDDGQVASSEKLRSYKGAALLRLPYGEGQVELFSGLRGFDNHHLRDPGRAALFEHLLVDPQPVGGMQIAFGRRQGFFALLWDRAWGLLILSGVLLVLWLWRELRRFGPPESDPAWDPEGAGIGRRREFVEHIHAAGRWYRSRKQGQRMIQAARSFEGKRTFERVQDLVHPGPLLPDMRRLSSPSSVQRSTLELDETKHSRRDLEGPDSSEGSSS